MERTGESKMLQLPNEIIVAVAGFLPRCDLHRFCLVNHRLLSVAQPVLYAKDATGNFSESLLWAAMHNRPAMGIKAVLAGANVDGWKPKQNEDSQIGSRELVQRDPNYHSRATVPLVHCDKSPLFIACLLGHLDMVKVLMGSGATPDWRTPCETFMSPASVAAAEGHLDILQYLHDSGYDFNQSECHYGTVLHCAAAHGRAEIVEFLVEAARVSIGAKNKDGITALSISLVHNSVTVFEYLLNHTPPKDGSVAAALRLAMDQPSGSCAQIILDSGKLNWDDRGENGDTVVGRAIRQGQARHVSLLVRHSDFDPSLMSAEGMTPLMQAKQALGYGGRPLKILLESDRISESDKFSIGKEVYSDAIRRSGCDELIELLLKKGYAGDDHTSHFHSAFEHGRPRIVHLLVDKFGVSVDCMQPNGLTAVQVTFLQQDVAMVKKLCDLGAMTTVVGRDNLPLLHCAARDGPSGMIQALLVKNADPNLRTQDSGETPLHFACAQGMKDRIMALLAHGADLKIYDNSGRTPYHLAARNCSEQQLKWLLSSRRLPPVLLQDGLTLLHEACVGRNHSSVKLLLQRKVNIESRTDKGETALHIAIGRCDAFIVQLLLNHGANIFAEANDKSTPITLAAESGNVQIMHAVQAKDGQTGKSVLGKRSLER